MSGFERIDPPELARPGRLRARGRSRTGRIVFLAGQTALDATGRIVGDGIVAQFEQALANLLDRPARGRRASPSTWPR